MGNDLTIAFAGGKLNVRVAAWIEKDDQLLVSTFPDGSISLPGGRIGFGENSVEAAKREVWEETGAEFLNPELFAIIENFFELDVAFHEYLFIYRGEINTPSIQDNPDDDAQVISWIPLDEIDQLKPHVLQDLVGQRTSNQVLHFMNYDPK